MIQDNLFDDVEDETASNPLDRLREEIIGCRRCGLWEHATQAVFGEGPKNAKVFLVGEQPGDQEDLQGRPFVGPAGRLLDECIQEAGLDRSEIYITNAVKHFKWEAKGSRRIHQKPNRKEVVACNVWLEAEIGAVQPQIIVCLGATAAQSLLGPGFRLTNHLGEFQTSETGISVLATYHPSAILRAPDEISAREMRIALVKDLKMVRVMLESS